jgi:sigma-B regulation protein RsbU (phosphoserine phosphatase)
MMPPPASRLPTEPEWKQFLRLGELLVRQPETQAQCRAIEESICALLGGSARLWLSRPFYPLPGEGEMEFLPSAPAPDLVQRARLEGKLLCADDRQYVGNTCVSDHPAWIAAVPLISNSNLLGVLHYQRSPECPIEESDFVLLEGLAGHAANALEISRQEKLKNWRLEQLGLVRNVSAQIGNLLNLDQLCARVTELIQSTFNFYYVAIFTTVGDPPVLLFRAATSQSGSQPLRPGDTIRYGDGLVGTAAQTGEQMIVPDALIDPHFHFIEALPETLSEACFPLKMENQVLGILDVQSDQLDAFHDSDGLVLSALADNIALAVHTARLYSDLETRANQITSVSEVSHALNSILEIDQLLNEVVQLIHRRFGYPHVHIYSVHGGRRLIIYQAGSGERSAGMRDQELCYSIDAPQGILPSVARNGCSFLANDVSQEPLYLASPLPPANTRAELAVPLLYGQEVIGILDIQSSDVNIFTPSDVTLFEALASTIAISYRNATLYRSEKWRRQVAESFRDIAYQISSNIDPEALLDNILERLENNLPCDASAIWLVDEHDNQLHLAATRGVDPQLLNRTLIDNADVFMALDLLVAVNQPYIRTSEDPLGPIGYALGYATDYSAISVPLRAGNRILGLLVLAHHTGGRYGSEASSMTSTFAGYAAVAIQNAHLFTEAQEQAWVATMLVQVAEATQSVLSVDDLLATMLRLTRLLVGVRKCAFFLRLENQPFYELKAWYGFEPSGSGSNLYPVTLSGLVRLDEVRALIYLNDPAMELGLPEVSLQGGPATEVMLPLQVRGEITGAFLVALEVPRNPADAPSLDPKSVSILQGIAHQTSVTVENLRLLEARQEEAYVTAALLQVAQAVVSANELPEVLENIVHLLPILVGIDVCLIYRWEDDLQVFRPVNAHGENRRQERFLLDNPYLPGEHHLLDAVIESRMAHICPVTQSGLPAEDWPQIACQPLEQYQQDEHQVQGDWLLGFPLTAQGRALGVMMVRERNATPAFRERRLEILSGIAQQTCLAIQNDILKREMVLNERIEREIQLARQIQETFLPERLPVVEGWEIDIRWQTARQVGGDFYDAFELKDGRVGLVVADVSDKGLPAALYMTVARTLIRASVRDHEDPADVLEEVNQLLFSESPESMFITAVYAILDTRKGELIYANAGHNRPLHFHPNSGSVKQLPKGGTALGVLEELVIEDHTIRMLPGDSILFFTDGVCDTLSATGDDFGEERLRESILAHAGEAASQLLTGIDQALAEFRNGIPLTDDITLLAVRRTPAA